MGVLRPIAWLIFCAAQAIVEELSPERARKRFETEKNDPDLVFRRYFEEIYRYCRQRVRSDADAEDIAAQVFSEAVRKLSKLKWQGKPVVAFLYGIAGRRIIDAYRRKQDTLDIAGLPEAEAATPSLDVLATHGRLGEAIAELPEEQRLCVFLQVVQGYSYREVAEISGKTEDSCQALVYRGLKALRVRLTELGMEPVS